MGTRILTGVSLADAVNESVLYTDLKGRPKKSLKKRKFKILNNCHSVLSRVLKEDEVIQYATTALAPTSLLEQLFFGWYVYYIKRSVLVFTNHRVLHIFVDRTGRAKPMIRELAYNDIDKAEVKGFLSGRLKLWYKSMKPETFLNIPSRDRKKIAGLIDKLRLPYGRLAPTAQGGMHAICPECFNALRPKHYVCDHCGMAFKSRAGVIKWSLLIPGGGYFYTGKMFLAVTDFFAEALLGVLFLLALAGVGAEGPEGVTAAVLLGGFLAFEKLLTIAHSFRFIEDFIPDPRRRRASHTVNTPIH